MALAAVLTNVLSPTNAEQRASLELDPSDAKTVVIVEEAIGMMGGRLRFFEVDLKTMKRGQRKFSINKDAFWGGRLSTTKKELRTSDEMVFWDPKVSRFSAGKRPAGDFALVEYVYQTEYGMNSRGSYCPTQGALVFRFGPGQASLISADMLPVNGKSVAAFTRPKLAQESHGDVTDAQRVLDEQGNIKATVRLAEIIGRVQFLDKNGNPASCGDGQRLMMVE